MRESITEIGVSIENARIERLAKPITHAFTYFKNDDERNKDDSINGRRRKMSSEMNGTCQILHSHETWHPSHFDLLELVLKVRVSQRPDCGKNMSKWISQVYQVPRH